MGVGSGERTRVLDPRSAAVALGDVFHEGEADPAPPHAGAGRRSRDAADEALEDAHAILGRHAGAPVDDADGDGAPLLALRGW